MNEIQNEYASALFSLAMEEDAAPEIAQEIAALGPIFQQQKSYLDFLASPSIPKEERTEALKKVLDQAHPFVRNLLCLMTENGHARFIPEMMEEFGLLYRASARISIASVRSVTPLDGQQKERLKKLLEKKAGHRVVISYSLDPSILGGMIVEMDSRVYDRSLRSELNEVKEAMTQ